MILLSPLIERLDFGQKTKLIKVRLNDSKLESKIRDKTPDESQIIFYGEEFTQHNNFIELINLTRQLDYKIIELVTNGKAFSSPKFVVNSVFAGVTDILVKFYSSSPEIHNVLSGEDSWSDVVKGLKNIIKLRQKVSVFFKPVLSVGIYLSEKNQDTLVSTLEFLESLEVQEIFIVKAGEVDDQLVRDALVDRKVLTFTLGFDTLKDYQKFKEDETNRVMKLSSSI